MPFGFGRRNKEQPAAVATSDVRSPADEGRPGRNRSGVAFDGLTEEWRLVGFIDLEGRLLDILNRREPIPIGDVTWAPLDALNEMKPAPGLQKVDPYDLSVVLAGDRTLPPLNDAEKAALRVHKVAYDVVLDVPPCRVAGTVFLHAGSEPERLMDRSSDLFFPVTNALVLVGTARLGDTDTDVVLVNRSYLRGVEQVEGAVLEAAREGPPAATQD
jgi:hypothetical protein